MSKTRDFIMWVEAAPHPRRPGAFVGLLAIADFDSKEEAEAAANFARQEFAKALQERGDTITRIRPH